MPDTDEYLSRIQSLAQSGDYLEQQLQTGPLLRSLITGKSGSVLNQAPAAGKWSVTEIIAHMAEDELVSSWRYRQMLEHDGCLLDGFDQDLWAKLGRYSEWSCEEALRMFELLRQANLRMFSSLDEEQWRRGGVHAERGRITVHDLAKHMAGHDRNHLQQIHNILRR